MSSVSVHILDADGYFVSTRSGDVDSVMLAVDIENMDFTMTARPNDTERWRWVNNEWVAEND